MNSEVKSKDIDVEPSKIVNCLWVIKLCIIHSEAADN